MSLLGLLFGEVEEPPERVEPPRPLNVHEERDVLYAPVSGTCLALPDVPDPIFASGAMGPGVGMQPSDGFIYAPASGTIVFMTSTLHAFGIRTDDGAEILVHAGVDTVDLKGDGFVGFSKTGRHVAAGEPLMGMDLDKIAKAGYSDVVIMVVTNASAYSHITIDVNGLVPAGEKLMRLQR